MEHGIDTGKVTKPLQLLAAWLIGLIVTNGSFLSAATQLEKPIWAAGALVLASIFNVPIFLGCLFLLQTRFRPEMQEDQYYSQYLETRYSTTTGQSETVDVLIERAVERPLQQPVLPHPEVLLPSKNKETSIWINDLLPTYEKLFNELREAGYPPTNIFGRSAKEPETPNPFIITISEDVDLDVLAIVTRAALSHGLQTVRKASKNYGNKRIYVGSYSYRAFPVKQVIPNKDLLKKIIDKKFNHDDLYLQLENE